jgi:16S rRNA C1402 (ribose-2'-O) methylase RsmI
MPDNKKPDNRELTTDVLMADIMLRLTAMERLLIEKKVFTQEELAKATEEIAQRVAKVVLEKAHAAKNLGELVSSLETHNKDKKDLKN